MNKQHRTYNLMARKERVALGKTAQKLSKSTESLNSARATEAKIEDLLAEKNDIISNVSSKFQLQSELWFGTELADQLEIIQSQNTLLEREVDALKKSVAQKEHKFRTITEKADLAKRTARDLKQEIQDSAALSHRTKR